MIRDRWVAALFRLSQWAERKYTGELLAKMLIEAEMEAAAAAAEVLDGRVSNVLRFQRRGTIGRVRKRSTRAAMSKSPRGSEMPPILRRTQLVIVRCP
jgi:hypothetical protein